MVKRRQAEKFHYQSYHAMADLISHIKAINKLYNETDMYFLVVDL
jgi:transposase-like protein